MEHLVKLLEDYSDNLKQTLANLMYKRDRLGDKLGYNSQEVGQLDASANPPSSTNAARSGGTTRPEPRSRSRPPAAVRRGRAAPRSSPRPARPGELRRPTPRARRPMGRPRTPPQWCRGTPRSGTGHRWVRPLPVPHRIAEPISGHPGPRPAPRGPGSGP